MVDVYISRMHFPVTTLGPGRRVGVWFQGCSIQCEGCVSLDTWAQNKGLLTFEALCAGIAPWLELADGLTISGGEPLDQSEALEHFLCWVRERFYGDILMFSGYAQEKVLRSSIVKKGLVDAIVPEPYKATESQTHALRGSDNQPLLPLTELGRQRYSELLSVTSSKRMDFMFDGESAWLAGIPSPNDFSLLEDALRARGHRVVTTADKRDSKGNAESGSSEGIKK